MHVSVVIPTYNRAGLLKQTLDSLLVQTYSKWECIVIDDGSTDETEQVVRQHECQTQYIRQENSGPAAARNRGIKRATGDSLLFLDSDDLLLPEALEVLVKTLDRHPDAGVAYGGFYGFYPDGSPGTIPEVPHLSAAPSSSPWPNRDVHPYGLSVEGHVLPVLLRHDAIVMGTSLVRQSVAEESGGFDPTLDFMEHWDFFLRLAQKGVPFAAANRPVLRIRMHDGNLSSDFESMLHHRLEMIDNYLPPAHSNRTSLRTEARANAYAFLGVCMCSSGQIKQGLRHLRSTLRHRPLTLEAYDALTQRLCKHALSKTHPETELQSLLRLLGPSANAQSLKDFVLSRFYRIQALERAKSDPRDAPWTWPSAGWKAGLSGLHLGRAVAYRPELGRTYARRIMKHYQ